MMTLLNKIRIIFFERYLNRNIGKRQDKTWLRYGSSLSGINNEKRKDRIVISLTSYPARIQIVHKTIRSIMLQTVKADRIILWLSQDQFPNKEDSLPKALLDLRKNGLEIKWCDNIRSYKKLVYTLREEPEAIIITIDDDVYYKRTMVQALYESYLKYPQDISCHRPTKFILTDKNNFTTISGGFEYYKGASFLNKLTGCGGVCYPPKSLYKDVDKIELILELAPTNDDIWFWLMGVLNGTKVRVVRKQQPYIHDVENTQKGEQLSAINDHGEKLFWKQFENIVQHYPLVKERLIEEAQQRKKD